MTEPIPTLCTSCGHALRYHIQVRSTGQVHVPCYYGDCKCRQYTAPRVSVVTR